MLHVHIIVAICVAFSHCLLIVLLLFFSCCCYYSCCFFSLCHCYSSWVTFSHCPCCSSHITFILLMLPSRTTFSSFFVMPLSLFSHYPYCSSWVAIVALLSLLFLFHFKYLLAQLFLFFLHCCYYVSLLDMVLPLPLPCASLSLKL
jgi:hypothetical protein